MKPGGSGLSRCPDLARHDSLALPKCAHHMLLGQPVALRHRRHHLAPRAMLIPAAIDDTDPIR
jgi:hypothetical protein